MSDKDKEVGVTLGEAEINHRQARARVAHRAAPRTLQQDVDVGVEMSVHEQRLKRVFIMAVCIDQEAIPIELEMAAQGLFPNSRVDCLDEVVRVLSNRGETFRL